MEREKIPTPKSSEITPKELYLNRRKFMVAAAALAAGSLLGPFAMGGCRIEAGDKGGSVGSGGTGGGKLNPKEVTEKALATGYTNYYEFTTSKEGVAEAARGFKSRPWSISVEGLVHKPRTFDLDELAKLFTIEERIYRFRCVEAWGMVLPWNGFQLSALLDLCQPLGSAKFVEFTTVMRPEEMPNQRRDIFEWPYTEGLRMDEARHRLTMLATGMYGEPLPAQNGAPVRLVVPWKYGFKSIKSIVRIRLTEGKPRTLWNYAAPQEYGFYANVNPEVDHPRWSQATERTLGLSGRRPTLMFNGYAEEVAQMYKGMDLRKEF